jgi:regulator of PEP synthase PpsR (kinase-PPPase family)
VPLVPGVPLPVWLSRAQAPLIVGLTVDPMRLAQVRAARLKSLNQDADAHYADLEELRKEVLNARRLFVLRGWPVIDVTQRSIEQTASQIVDMLAPRAAGPR